jgi:hypothetical protein
MAIATHKETGMSFVEDIEVTSDLPHTISFAVMYTAKINSFNELSKDKRPPRALWDKPYRLEQFLDEVFDVNYKPKEKEDLMIEFDPEEVE